MLVAELTVYYSQNTSYKNTSELNAQIYYTTTNVNLREEPNTNSKVLSVINKNETVKVTIDGLVAYIPINERNRYWCSSRKLVSICI